jgi:hypothetical protein
MVETVRLPAHKPEVLESAEDNLAQVGLELRDPGRLSQREPHTGNLQKDQA